jgi:nitrogen fixation protein NifU and related proteins
MENKDLIARLRDIYSDATIEHILRPHNTESVPNADGFADFTNNSGENMKIWLKIQGDLIQDASFWTNGCAATIACGSMCTDLAKGQSVAQALRISAKDIADALIDLPDGNFHCAEFAAGALRTALKDAMSIQQQPWKKLYRK